MFIKSKTVNEFWFEHPGVVKQHLELENEYGRLCSEVAYILKKSLNEQKIEYSTISFRVKSLKSFVEKVIRKNYSDPFNEITDFAGVRVIYLYKEDFENIDNVITKNFYIVETVDKYANRSSDSFGYNAIHYLVQLNQSFSGARYDDLKNMICEIQVRTVLQDAWAIIGHHLIYKSESEIPKILRRKLNSLAGLFETADYQFDQIRDERGNYLSEVEESKSDPKVFLENDLNADSWKQYLFWKRPNLPLASYDGQEDDFFSQLAKIKLKKLKDVDHLVEKAEKQKVKKIREAVEKDYDHRGLPLKWSGTLEIMFSVGLVDDVHIANSETSMLEYIKKAKENNL